MNNFLLGENYGECNNQSSNKDKYIIFFHIETNIIRKGISLLRFYASSPYPINVKFCINFLGSREGDMLPLVSIKLKQSTGQILVSTSMHIHEKVYLMT